jgi:hypothetical protein
MSPGPDKPLKRKALLYLGIILKVMQVVPVEQTVVEAMAEGGKNKQHKQTTDCPRGGVRERDGRSGLEWRLGKTGAHGQGYIGGLLSPIKGSECERGFGNSQGGARRVGVVPKFHTDMRSA